MSTGKRLHLSYDERKKLILQCAIDISRTFGLFNFTLDDVAAKANCSESLVKKYYPGGIGGLRGAVYDWAISNDDAGLTGTSIVKLVD